MVAEWQLLFGWDFGVREIFDVRERSSFYVLYSEIWIDLDKKKMSNLKNAVYNFSVSQRMFSKKDFVCCFFLAGELGRSE